MSSQAQADIDRRREGQIARAALLWLAAAFPGLAAADNAALTSGGQPRMMSGHPTVQMESEVVRLVVHSDRVDADCSFVFVNGGKACTVNMGFPDFGLWAYAYPKKKAASIFKQYRSYVDGKPVKTKLVLGKNPGEQWQTKSVSFPAHGGRVVREVYTTELGGVGISRQEAWGFASYLLHTGASWKGNIGKATIVVTLDSDTEVTTPLDVMFGKWGKLNEAAISKQVSKPGGVVVIGLSTPTVRGRTLTFTRQNWNPTTDDDIYVGFEYSKKALQREMEKAKKGSKPPPSPIARRS